MVVLTHTHTRCSTKQVGSGRMQPGWCSNDLAATSSPLMLSAGNCPNMTLFQLGE